MGDKIYKLAWISGSGNAVAASVVAWILTKFPELASVPIFDVVTNLTIIWAIINVFIWLKMPPLVEEEDLG